MSGKNNDELGCDIWHIPWWNLSSSNLISSRYWGQSCYTWSTVSYWHSTMGGKEIFVSWFSRGLRNREALQKWSIYSSYTIMGLSYLVPFWFVSPSAGGACMCEQSSGRIFFCSVRDIFYLQQTLTCAGSFYCGRLCYWGCGRGGVRGDYGSSLAHHAGWQTGVPSLLLAPVLGLILCCWPSGRVTWTFHMVGGIFYHASCAYNKM